MDGMSTAVIGYQMMIMPLVLACTGSAKSGRKISLAVRSAIRSRRLSAYMATQISTCHAMRDALERGEILASAHAEVKITVRAGR